MDFDLSQDLADAIDADLGADDASEWAGINAALADAEGAAEDEWTCAACGADWIIDGCIEVYAHEDGTRELAWCNCCEAAQAEYECGGIEGITGKTFEALVMELVGGDVQRVEAGQEVTRGREVELADADGLIVEKLTTEIVTGGAAQAELFKLIDGNHRHHDAPRGWHFGVVARRGALVVGVVTCGRPVSRHLQAQGCVEVTRCCVFGDDRLKRDVASALYRAAFREYVRRDCTWTTEKGKTSVFSKLITYTLPTESGASLRAAGFQDEGAAGGGSWARAARPREAKAPVDVKTRWSLPLPAPRGASKGAAKAVAAGSARSR